MNATLVAPTEGMDRAEWLDLRRKGIGGSDAPAICGLDRWRSAFEVYLDKIGELPDSDAGEAAQWGNLLEPVVADEFTRRTGIETRPVGAMLRHPDRPHMLANLDRLAFDPIGDTEGLYEGKTTSVYLADEWADGKVPDRAAIQTHHYLAVTGHPWAYVAALIGGQRLEVRRIDRDDDVIANLLAIEDEFWQRVQDRRPPPVDGSPATADLLASLYEVEPESIAVLPPDVDGLLRRRADLKAVIKEAEAGVTEVENVVKQLLGPAEIGVLDGEVVCTWKQMPEAPVAASVRKAHRRFTVPKGARRG